MKKQLLRVLLVISFLTSAAASLAQPKREFRAAWIQCVNGQFMNMPAQTMQNTLAHQLDMLQQTGCNAIIFQVRAECDALYANAKEPWSRFLTGEQGKAPTPFWDPLQWMITECHKRGMELHAWVVAIPVGKWGNIGCKRLHSRHRNIVKRIGNEGFMYPDNPQTAKYIADICDEITRNYDIDGIHLDYIRYPEQDKPKPSALPACRRNITRIVREINAKVKSRKPWVKISCSPLGKYSDLSRYRSYGWNA